MRTNLPWSTAEGRTSLAGHLKDSGSSTGDTSSTCPSSPASKNSGVENFDDMATSPAEAAAAAATTPNQGSSNDEVLEMYRGEIEDLRRQLRESQEVRHREEEAQREIVELRRQLENTIDSEALTNALKYLDQVIQRISSQKSKARTKTTRSMRRSEVDTKQASDDSNAVEVTPIRADKKVVELEFCPTLHRKVSADTEDGSEGSWRPVGALKRLMDDISSVATSSLPGSEDGGTSPIPFGQSTSIMSTIYGTANGDASSASVSSWQPTAAMAALVAGMSDDSTVNTLLTAGDDDFDDMHTCVSALTSPTNAGRSRGTGSIISRASTNVSKDDTAAMVSQLYQVQSLLLTILKDKEAASKDGGMPKNESKASPNTEKMSSKSKSIANVRENQLNGVDKRNDQDNEKRHDIPVQKKKSDDQTRAKQLTKEDAEQIISSLAAIF